MFMQKHIKSYVDLTINRVATYFTFDCDMPKTGDNT